MFCETSRRHYPGTITKRNTDGTFAIRFNVSLCERTSFIDRNWISPLTRDLLPRKQDGDRKDRVRKTFIRKLGGDSDSSDQDRERGRNRSRERNSGNESDSASASLRVGDEVEAKVSSVQCTSIVQISSAIADKMQLTKAHTKVPGWTKYYPGKISKKNANGTFAIRFKVSVSCSLLLPDLRIASSMTHHSNETGRRQEG